MLPLLLVTFSPPPELLPTEPWPRIAFPVPPPGVLTVIDTAPAVALVVEIEAAFWSYPSLPAPSVLAARVRVPDPAFTSAARAILSALARTTLPVWVLVVPATVRVPSRLRTSTFPAPVAVAVRVAPSVSARKSPPAPAAAVMLPAVVVSRWDDAPIPFEAVRLTTGLWMVPAPVMSVIPLTVTEASEVTSPLTASEPVPEMVTGTGPALSAVTASVPVLVRNTNPEVPAAGPETVLVPPPDHPAAVAAAVSSITPAVSVIVTVSAERATDRLLLSPSAEDTVTTPAGETSSRVAAMTVVTVATMSFPSPPA